MIYFITFLSSEVPGTNTPESAIPAPATADSNYVIPDLTACSIATSPAETPEEKKLGTLCFFSFFHDKICCMHL